MILMKLSNCIEIKLRANVLISFNFIRRRKDNRKILISSNLKYIIFGRWFSLFMLNFCLSSTGHVSFLDKTFVFNCFFFKNSEFKMNSIVLFDELINFYKKKRKWIFVYISKYNTLFIFSSPSYWFTGSKICWYIFLERIGHQY